MSSITVIIPCHNNEHALPWILKSISASKVRNLEVICVDDASTVNIKEITDTYEASYLRLPEGIPGRRAMARNYGHRAATGEITFYLDGDIIPEPRLFIEATRLHTNAPRIAVKYPVYSISETDHTLSLPSLAALVISQNLPRLGPTVRKHVGIDTRPLPRRLRGKQTNIWVLCASHCTSIFRREVEAAGGWDETFQGWGEEDLELAYRLHRNGVMFLYPHRKFGAAYHLDHSVHWGNNLASLNRNLAYFRRKFPDCWSGRRGLLQMFLHENNLPPLPAMTEEESSQIVNVTPDERKAI